MRSHEIWDFAPQFFSYRADILIDLRVACSRVKPPENVTNVGLIVGVRLRSERCPNVSRRSESEFLTRDADHGPQLAAKPDGAADNSAISSKAPLPKRVAEHNSVGSARAIFVLRKAAAEHGLYPQSAEKVRTDTEGMKVLRLSRAREIDADARKSKAVRGH